MAPGLPRLEDRRGAALHPDLLEYVLDVLLHRARARFQDEADLAVGLSLCDPAQHLGLAGREPQRLETRRRRVEHDVFQAQQVQVLAVIHHDVGHEAALAAITGRIQELAA